MVHGFIYGFGDDDDGDDAKRQLYKNRCMYITFFQTDTDTQNCYNYLAKWVI